MIKTALPDNTAYQLAEWEKSNNEEYLEQLLGPMEIKPGSRILDLGCGSGYVSAYLSSRADPERNLAVDYDAEALRLARRMTRAAGSGRIDWICALAERVPLPRDGFDHIICRGVLPLTDVPRATAEIGRLLAPGGTILLLLHPWSFYTSQLSLRPSRWKKTAVALSVLAAGLLFHTTGVHWRARVPGRRVTESVQTVSRMRKLLRAHNLTIYKVVTDPEFLIYARKD